MIVLMIASFLSKEWMYQIFGTQFNKKMRIIPGGVNLSQFPEHMDASDVDNKYHLKDKRLVLFSGKLTKYKGVKYLFLTSAARIHELLR